MANNASAENWFIIHSILETKVKVRAGDVIHTMYDDNNDKISAFNFRCYPLATK